MGSARSMKARMRNDQPTSAWKMEAVRRKRNTEAKKPALKTVSPRRLGRSSQFIFPFPREMSLKMRQKPLRVSTAEMAAASTKMTFSMGESMAPPGVGGIWINFIKEWGMRL